MTDRPDPAPGATPPEGQGGSREGEDLSATRLRRVLDLPRPALGVLADFELEGSRTGFGSAPCHHGESSDSSSAQIAGVVSRSRQAPSTQAIAHEWAWRRRTT